MRKKRKYKLKHEVAAPLAAVANRDAVRGPVMFGGIQGALPWANGMLFWPTLEERHEVDEFDRMALMKACRYLYRNSGIIRKAVSDIWLLQGALLPCPMTQDAEWNRAARAAFLARVNNPELFDVTAQLSWKLMQKWAENRVSIDGDCLIVLSRGRDGGGTVACYSAPKVVTHPDKGEADGWCQGVQTDAHGKPIAYGLERKPGEVQIIPAASAILYRRSPSPAQLRGEPDLIHAVRHGVDIAEIHGFTKASVKLSSAVGFVETKPQDDKTPGIQVSFGAKGRKGEQQPAAPAPPAPDPTFEIVTGGGARVVSLAPGRDIKAVYDQRPSPNVQAFIRDLLAEIAFGMGLDAEVLYDINKLGSAAARLILTKTRRWIDDHKAVREVMLNRVYRHVLACEMESGRLSRCKDASWENVEWVGPSDMTIDVGREGALAINLVREGLADADRWTMATEGMPAEAILERRAHLLARAHKISEKHGVPMNELLPGSIGATHQPHEVPDSPQPADIEPETTSEERGTGE